MAVTVNINGLTLCHAGSGGVSQNTLPDVCKTPGQGVPMPYPNIALSSDLAQGTTTVFADGGNMIANYGSQFSKSSGDEAGSMGGVTSGTNMAEADWITHSFDVFFEKKAACRLTDKMFMNHRNTVNMAGLIQRNLPEDDLKFFDELCQIACDCMKKHGPEGPEPLGTGQQYQTCVRKKIDEKHYDGRYPKDGAKVWREVPFDANNEWDMIGSKANPNVPTSNFIRPDSRRLDVVRTDGSGNMTKMYDMKFGPDELTESAEADYKAIAKKHTGSGKNFEEFRVDQKCNCDDDWPPKNPAPVTAEQKESLLNKASDAIYKSTGVRLTGAALIAYLVISEGSRVFPPRDLVPVP
jgi:hypothetical protein